MTDLDSLFATYGSLLWLALLAGFLLLLLFYLRLQASFTRMQVHYQRLARSGGGGLEEILERQMDKLDEASVRLSELDATCQKLEHTLEGAVQHVGLVRFNPFTDTGGDQSFSIALLDARGDGLVLSSLFSRAETRVFAKPIQRGHSKYNLTAEEREAIELAGGATPAAAGS